MLLFQNIVQQPWWVTVTLGTLTIVFGVLNLIQFWKSKEAVRWKAAADSWEAQAHAFEAERNALRETRNVLLEKSKEDATRIAVLEAKTDLNGLREQVTVKMNEMTREFARHSEQDLTTAKEQIAALQAVKAAIEKIER